ncbi:RICIN domain-containing protein [Nonomuraea rhodomycinica]|uniref:Ricin-type beta-trefoil lectin domain protein n=1 Tax=Nonomuraea rhodomycinica TaxID=1712872 RepID=A0A7Y6IYD5_9ACTN|nr:RICIN domain-containing protein [Nonomuraea rhodomycinica]NUW46288.1 ricin-type beta-trefoil lectin domain protein [Nonomuraea rhodomycinica]
MLARHLLAAAAISAAVGAVTPLPAVAADGAAPIGTAMCVDLSNNRGNGTLMYQWACDTYNNNQRFVVEDGLIKVADTIGRNPVMCMDSSNGRTNGTRVYQWQCLGNANQLWVLQNGQIILKSTLNSSNRLCLDATGNRGNGVQVYLWQCDPNNNNQKFVIGDGQIAIKDTLS